MECHRNAYLINMEFILIKLTILIQVVQCQFMPQDLHQFGTLPGGFHGLQEDYTNKTIDEILTKKMGGIHGVANKMMDPSGKIIAELDMMLTPPQYNMLYHRPGSRKRRKAARLESLRWSGAELPYQFVKNDFDDREIYFMKLAMTEWEKYTCVRFRPYREMDRNIVRIKNGNGCNSQLGMVGGIQELNLEPPGCRYKGLYLHEMGHAIGLVHEHQLPNRDDHIDILWQNVDPQMKIWFDKYDAIAVNQFKIPYEYSSVMHYGITAFSKDGSSQTISAKNKDLEGTIGNVYRKELSFTDVKTVNTMYNCSGHCSSKIRCADGGYVDQTCNCICPDGSSDCEVGKELNYIDNCGNIHDSWQCYMWAKQGECVRNPDFMRTRCMQACGLCDKPTEDKTVKNGECRDTFPVDKCQRWSTYDECLTNKEWMEVNCRKTCHACETKPTLPPTTTCSNTLTDKECQRKLADGGCQMDKMFMYENCRKSCQWCSKSPDETDSDDEAEIDENEEKLRCIDSYEHPEKCKPWADQGECEKNSDWMIPNCRKSCNKCINEGECRNLFDSAKCDGWARVGECDINPTWMKVHCQKSCNTCQEFGKTTTRRPTYERTTAQVKTGECTNKYNDRNCRVWAKHGHCNINPDFMLKSCKRSCGICDDYKLYTTMAPKTTEAPKTKISTTTERSAKTSTIVRAITTPSPTVRITTTGSQGDSEDGDDNTTHDPVTCFDSNENCRTWAEFGFCATNPGYNLVYCKMSCQNCNGCKDEDTSCAQWAKEGHCTRNVSYMLRHCQKSCKVCEK